MFYTKVRPFKNNFKGAILFRFFHWKKKFNHITYCKKNIISIVNLRCAAIQSTVLFLIDIHNRDWYTISHSIYTKSINMYKVTFLDQV